MRPVRFSGRSKLADLRRVRELEGREAMKLKDVWPSWPSGRPIRQFYIPKRVIRIRKIPRLLPVGTEPTAKAVASLREAETADPAPQPAPPVYDRPAPRNYDEEQREVGRLLGAEIVPLAFEMAVDAGRVAVDFLGSMASNLTATRAPDNAIVAPSTPPSAPGPPAGPGPQDLPDNHDNGAQPYEPAYSGGPGALRGPIVGKESLP